MPKIEEKFTDREKDFLLENLKNIYFIEKYIDKKLHIQMYLNEGELHSEVVVPYHVYQTMDRYNYQEYQALINLKTNNYKTDTLLEQANIPKFTIIHCYLVYLLGRWHIQEEMAYAFLKAFCYCDEDGYYHIKEELLTRNEKGEVKYQRGQEEDAPKFIKYTPEQERFTYDQLQRRLNKPYPSLLREDVELLRLSSLAVNYKKDYLKFFKDTRYDLNNDGDILCYNEKTGLLTSISIYNRSIDGDFMRDEKNKNNKLRKIKEPEQKILIETIRSKKNINRNVKDVKGIDVMDFSIAKKVIDIIDKGEKGTFIVK